jgi:nucleoside 2-deoxyribosyltransferase
MKTLYLAGPLFSEAERDWHIRTKQLLEERATERGEEIEVIWPYELMTLSEIESLGNDARFEIFKRCKQALDKTDFVVALLDGTQVDDGTAWEIGYFYGIKAQDSKIIGIRTDFRNAGDSKDAIVNAMIEIACDHIVHNRDDLLASVFPEVLK